MYHERQIMNPLHCCISKDVNEKRILAQLFVQHRIFGSTRVCLHKFHDVVLAFQLCLLRPANLGSVAGSSNPSERTKAFVLWSWLQNRKNIFICRSPRVATAPMIFSNSKEWQMSSFVFLVPSEAGVEAKNCGRERQRFWPRADIL